VGEWPAPAYRIKRISRESRNSQGEENKKTREVARWAVSAQKAKGYDRKEAKKKKNGFCNKGEENSNRRNRRGPVEGEQMVGGGRNCLCGVVDEERVFR